MKLFSALFDSQRRRIMSCILGKSSLLFFCFAKNREDDFSLRYVKFRDKFSMRLRDKFYKDFLCICREMTWYFSAPLIFAVKRRGVIYHA